MADYCINHVRGEIAPLIGLPLQKITRAADMLCLHFGQLIEKRCAVRGEDGKFTVAPALVGEFALHISCCFRLSCGRHIIAAKSDLYQMSAEARGRLGDEIPEDYDYDPIGNNRLDEIIASSLSDLSGFIVKKITVRRFGDLQIEFENRFELEIIVDLSGGEECWRFFRQGEMTHLVVTGQEIAAEEQEQACGAE